jgi:hypothetical protein
MPIFRAGTKPANVERNQDVPVTPKGIKRRGKGKNVWQRAWKSSELQETPDPACKDSDSFPLGHRFAASQ